MICITGKDLFQANSLWSESQESRKRTREEYFEGAPLQICHCIHSTGESDLWERFSCDNAGAPPPQPPPAEAPNTTTQHHQTKWQIWERITQLELGLCFYVSQAFFFSFWKLALALAKQEEELVEVRILHFHCRSRRGRGVELKLGWAQRNVHSPLKTYF